MPTQTVNTVSGARFNFQKRAQKLLYKMLRGIKFKRAAVMVCAEEELITRRNRRDFWIPAGVVIRESFRCAHYGRVAAERQRERLAVR